MVLVRKKEKRKKGEKRRQKPRDSFADVILEI